MHELRPFVGLSPGEFHQRLGHRRVLIWGGNGACSEVVAALQGVYGLTSGDVLAVAAAGLQRFSGFSVQHPDAYLSAQPVQPGSHMVIVSSVGYRKEIVRRLEDAGFAKGRDYLFNHDLFRQRIQVRVVDDPIHSAPSLNIPRLTAFLAKNSHALRGATLEITGFPDPFSHAGVEDLIINANATFPITLTSHLPNLQLLKMAERHAVRLRLLVFPSVARLRHHFPVVAKWDDEEYFAAIGQLLRAVPENCPIELVKVAFPDKHPADAMFSVRHNIIYSADRAYPVDFAHLLSAMEHGDTRLLAKQQALCDFDLREALSNAKAQQHKPCMCERVYPVLNADASWAVCHLHFQGILCEESDLSDYSQIQEERRFNAYCKACQRQGLHRFDVNLLG